jgi:hypothetical protein
MRRWVETDSACTVEVLGHQEDTWLVAGHHYALVCIDALDPGEQHAIRPAARRGGGLAAPDSPFPPCRIRALDAARALRVTFGSCRYARTSAVAGNKKFDADALDAFARRLARLPDDRWRDALVLLGDQVYADETTDRTKQRIRAKRDIMSPPKDEVADFEEYTWLYEESWTDPGIRWLLSTRPSSMIFDDHDVRDDWNTSDQWCREMQATTWWQERIIGALSSYWIYQHLGNLAPQELAENSLYQTVRAHDGDVAPLLRDFAAAADKEADG